ncbi:permease-like cell division protein FtsX [Desulfuromonas sp. KJ2020]|uniref:permease-like cell division protein FtsX n=1 Tax=Desulfuromonas sp. KJ2020 TaxID=2919173 RepID=UPI0020A7681C|nr:permease-like cell division protein FtsX [Desulfuromonas sp. KJ2020]MCP3178255.1 permease-like cell division protein FtsX [Desulfuromonas sp. KJ2020]
MFESLLYFPLRALRNMRQSPFLCTAAIATVAVSLTILAFFAIVVLNVQKLTSHWSKEVQIVAYLDQTPDQGQLKVWMTEISNLPEVAAVTYVSPAEAHNRFKTRLGQDAGLLDGLATDILPASLEITLKEDQRNRLGIGKVISHLRQDSRFSDLRYGQEWLEKFEAFVALLKMAGAFLGGFLLFAALFIVSNTIRLTLFARRDELEVMALVGGTPLFIKAPFLLEGAFQGAIGGCLALAGSYMLYLVFLKEGLSSLLLTTGVNTITFLPSHYGLAVILAGLTLGFLGSLLSLRKLVRI